MYVLAPNQAVETFPYSIGALRRDNPNTSFPKNPPDELLAEWGVFPVEPVEPSLDPATQSANRLDPVFTDGKWVDTWDVYTVDQEEIDRRAEAKGAEVRTERDKLLSASDWTQLSDTPVDHEVWAVYRQELRDVPQQEGFPWGVTWPVQP
jgi:hypothetical protein